MHKAEAHARIEITREKTEFELETPRFRLNNLTSEGVTIKRAMLVAEGAVLADKMTL